MNWNEESTMRNVPVGAGYSHPPISFSPIMAMLRAHPVKGRREGDESYFQVHCMALKPLSILFSPIGASSLEPPDGYIILLDEFQVPLPLYLYLSNDSNRKHYH
jgi:hypothetical protein